MVGNIGGERVVLCRCDNREAIDFGKSVGIELYQGRYIESLLADDDRRLDLLRLKRRIERSDEKPEDEDGDEDIEFDFDDD